MSFTGICVFCKISWIFHDDDKGLLLCDACTERWNWVQVAQEIMAGKWPELDESETGAET